MLSPAAEMTWTPLRAAPEDVPLRSTDSRGGDDVSIWRETGDRSPSIPLHGVCGGLNVFLLFFGLSRVTECPRRAPTHTHWHGRRAGVAEREARIVVLIISRLADSEN